MIIMLTHSSAPPLLFPSPPSTPNPLPSLVAECFVGFPLAMSGNYPEKLRNLAKERAGLTECALPPQYPQFPCTCLNSGLLILSKRPIIEFKFELYAYQVPIEIFS